MLKNACSIILLGLILTGCAPDPEVKYFNDLKFVGTEFPPQNSDRILTDVLKDQFDVRLTLSIHESEKSQIPWLKNSAEIFQVAEKAMVIGYQLDQSHRADSEVSSGKLYKKFGHNLLSLFYSKNENATQMDANRTMYLPAALGFEGEKIYKMLQKVTAAENIKIMEDIFNSCRSSSLNQLSLSKEIEQLDINKNYVEPNSGCHRVQWPETVPTLAPIGFIWSIKNYLIETGRILTEKKATPELVQRYNAQIEKDYLQVLSRAEIDLAEINEKQSLAINSKVIAEVISYLTFLPEEIRLKLLDELNNKAQKYAGWIQENDPSSPDLHEVRLVRVLSNVWLDLNPVQREAYIKSASVELYDRYNKTSDRYIKWLAGREDLNVFEKHTTGNLLKSGLEDGLKLSCHKSIYSKLADEWLKLDKNGKQKFKEENSDLFLIFSHYSNKEIKENILPYYNPETGRFDGDWEFNGKLAKKFIENIAPVCLRGVQVALDNAINKYVLAKLDTQIRNLGSVIEKIVEEKTLGRIKDMTEKIQTDEGFLDYFTGLAIPKMNKMLFSDGSKTLNAVESDQVQLLVNKDSQFDTQLKGSPKKFQTGAETLGSSLAAQYYRFLGLKEFENHAVNSVEYYQTVFSQINKMLAMIGFKKLDKSVVPSLHRHFSGPAAELDVYRYECDNTKLEKQKIKKELYKKSESPDDFVDWREDCEGSTDQKESLFLVPDHLEMDGVFQPGKVHSQSVSVRSQAEIIRGAALMLKYFQDWKQQGDDYDLGMGKEAFDGIVVFPKHAFVNLTVGLMTTPIRGIRKEAFPIRLFNVFGSEITDWKEKGLKCELVIGDPNCNPNSLERQPLQAVITDLGELGPSEIVKTTDMARFILAIDEFLVATEGLEKTKASVINPPLKTVKENLNLILDGRRQLKLMMFGMSNFLTARLQSKDGGFWGEYSLKTNQIIQKDKPRSLEDQVLAIQALLKVYEQWNSGGARLAAIESYYFMNSVLWNEQSGFYSTEKIKPTLYFETLIALSQLGNHLLNDADLVGKTPYKESGEQVKKLFEFYSNEFLKWNNSRLPIAAAVNK